MCSVEFRKHLRNNSTEAEIKLWSLLRQRRISGIKFRRQYQIGSYIVDFVSLRKKVVIELDGGQHLTRKQYDKKRDEYIAKKGYKVLRFWNRSVIEDVGAVLEEIFETCENRH